MNEKSASDARIWEAWKNLKGKEVTEIIRTRKINQRLQSSTLNQDQIINIGQDQFINIEYQDQINNIIFNQIGYQSEQLNDQTIKYSIHQIRSSSNAENSQSEKTHSVNLQMRKPIQSIRKTPFSQSIRENSFSQSVRGNQFSHQINRLQTGLPNLVRALHSSL